MSTFDKVAKLGKEKFDLDIKFKDESIFMKMLGFILFFNPSFMKSYTTTIGNTVYFSSRVWLKENEESAARVLAHELVHIADADEAGSFIFSYSYLFPQSFAILSMIAIFGSFWWLLCLLFLLPMPAPMRTYFELRGYAMSDAVTFKSEGQFTNIDWMSGHFTSSDYFFMWPFKNDIQLRILENRNLIKFGKLSNKIDIADEIIACF